ncbi:2-dehydropantoate 2-reductase [Backusella circina FSU 941]|nr:2-dehydropantoate 2-reductase [Backusella circina FSU 941]
MHAHILGTGAIGCHIGSALRAHRHKVTLLLRSQEHLSDFRKRENTISYRRNGDVLPITGFDATTIDTLNEPIEALIVSTKAHYTASALAPIASRLTPDSTILLLQNGMGISEELVNQFWPRHSPRILVGVNKHAIERIAPYDVVHHYGYEHKESLMLGEYPINNGSSNEQSKLVDSLTRIPDMHAVLLPWPEMKVRMLRKLIINGSINAIASLLNLQNKGFAQEKNPAIYSIMKSVCEEIHQVFNKDLPGESVDSFMESVMHIVDVAAETACSTVQDIRAQRLTEIDYINGYVCKRGKELGIPTPINQTLVNLVHAKEFTFPP